MELQTKMTSRGMAVYSTEQAEGAIANGTRIVKCLDEPGDKHKIGDQGVVIGSIDARDVPDPPLIDGKRSDYLYFVEWDDFPEAPICVVSLKIEPLSH